MKTSFRSASFALVGVALLMGGCTNKNKSSISKLSSPGKILCEQSELEAESNRTDFICKSDLEKKVLYGKILVHPDKKCVPSVVTITEKKDNAIFIRDGGNTIEEQITVAMDMALLALKEENKLYEGNASIIAASNGPTGINLTLSLKTKKALMEQGQSNKVEYRDCVISDNQSMPEVHFKIMEQEKFIKDSDKATRESYRTKGEELEISEENIDLALSDVGDIYLPISSVKSKTFAGPALGASNVGSSASGLAVAGGSDILLEGTSIELNEKVVEKVISSIAKTMQTAEGQEAYLRYLETKRVKILAALERLNRAPRSTETQKRIEKLNERMGKLGNQIFAMQMSLKKVSPVSNVETKVDPEGNVTTTVTPVPLKEGEKAEMATSRPSLPESMPTVSVESSMDEPLVTLTVEEYFVAKKGLLNLISSLTKTIENGNSLFSAVFEVRLSLANRALELIDETYPDFAHEFEVISHMEKEEELTKSKHVVEEKPKEDFKEIRNALPL